jgi:hypothetical protein
MPKPALDGKAGNHIFIIGTICLSGKRSLNRVEIRLRLENRGTENP